MIRLTYLLCREPGMSRIEFQRYWKEVHGPLVASFANSLNILRYVQVHTILDEALNEQLPGARGAMEKTYDGVEEIWWDKHEEMIASQNSASGASAWKIIFEDEKKFIDLPNSPLWFNYEYPQVNPYPENIVATEFSSLLKSYYAIRHLPVYSLKQAQLYWHTCHGFLLRRLAVIGHIKRYLQIHRYEDEMELVMRKKRGTLVDSYTGHAEVWFDQNDMNSAVPEIKKGWELAVEDERKFIDFSRSGMWFGKEHVFVDHC